MQALIPLIGAISVLLLIYGLISPNKALMWYSGNRTRQKVLLFYGIPFVLCIVFTKPRPQSDKPTVSEEVKLTPAEQKTKDSLDKIRDEEIAKNRAEKERKEKIEKAFSEWDGSHIGLTKFVKKSMHDPSTYEHVKTIYYDEKEHLTVITQFRGKNPLGAVVMNFVKAKVDLEGNVLEVIEQG